MSNFGEQAIEALKNATTIAEERGRDNDRLHALLDEAMSLLSRSSTRIARLREVLVAALEAMGVGCGANDDCWECKARAALEEKP